ncbi:MAG: DUF3662 and FHA domain-containing protein [Veillonellales bacterium]
MKIVRNLEDFFEKYIEGFFNNKFSSGLQPVEIAKQLAKEMENNCSIGVSHVYVPNSYQVYINSADFELLSTYSQTVCEELSSYLVEEAARNDYTIIGGKPSISLQLDEISGQEKFRVASSFTKPLPSETKSNAGDPAACFSDTRVFDKVKPLSNCPAVLDALLTIIDGLDAGKKIDVATSRINIGRREGNELSLADMNTSRLHAYIVYDDGVHVLHDAKSLNGTYVDGHRITRKELQHGDRIKIGNTIILYEVK